MRKTFLFFVMSVFLFVLSFSLTVKVGIYDNSPLSFYKNGSAHGILVNVMNSIAQKENWKVEYVYEPFSRLLTDLKSGKIDMLLGIAETKESRFVISPTNIFCQIGLRCTHIKEVPLILFLI